MNKQAFLDGYLCKEAARPWNITNSLVEAFRKPRRQDPVRTRSDRQSVVSGAGRGVGSMPWTKEHGGTWNDPVPQSYRDEVQKARGDLDTRYENRSPKVRAQYEASKQGQRPVRDMVAPGKQVAPSGRRDPVKPGTSEYAQELARLRKAPSQADADMARLNQESQYKSRLAEYNKRKTAYNQKLHAQIKQGKISNDQARRLWQAALAKERGNSRYKDALAWQQKQRGTKGNA